MIPFGRDFPVPEPARSGTLSTALTPRLLRTVLFLACAAHAAACSAPPGSRAGANPIDQSDKPRQPEQPADDTAPFEPPASADDVRLAREYADALCACVDQVGEELECARKIRRQSERPLPRSDKRVAREIERAQLCLKLAKLEADDDRRSLLGEFLEGLFR